MKKPAQLSGGARLTASGKKPMLLGLTPEQHEEIRLASAAEGRPMAQYAVFHLGLAAKKTLQKMRNVH